MAFTGSNIEMSLANRPMNEHKLISTARHGVWHILYTSICVEPTHLLLSPLPPRTAHASSVCWNHKNAKP